MLFNGVLEFFDDLLNGFILVINLQGIFDHNTLKTPFLLDKKPLLVKGPPEAVDDHGDHDGFVILYDKRRTLPKGFPGSCGPLGEGNDPPVIERFANVADVAQLHLPFGVLLTVSVILGGLL